MSVAKIQTDYEAGLNATANSLSGTVTIPPDSAGIPNATVRRKTQTGDLNLNGTQADYGDLVMMNYAATGRLTPDWNFDLNGNGDLADAGDLLMLEDAAAGKIELW